MADKDQGDGPSLEMPTMGSLFKRKRKNKGTAEEATTPAAADFDALVRGEKSSPSQSEPQPEPQPEPEPVVDSDSEPTVIVPAPDQPADVEQTPPPVVDERVELPREPEPEPTPVRESEPEPTTILDEPAVAAGRGAASPASGRTQESGFEHQEDARPDSDGAHDRDYEGVYAGDYEDDYEDEDAESASPKRRFVLPHLPGRIAAAVTGLVIGLMAVGLTYVSLRGCEAVQGTSSCGTPGFFLLVAILIVLVAVGSALLGAWQVTDPTSTSFLAVALLAVIALLFLIQVIFSPWMFLVIPLVAVVTYVLSQWLTSLFEDEFDEDLDEDIVID